MENNEETYVLYPDVVSVGPSMGIVIPKNIIEVAKLKRGDRLKVQFFVIERSESGPEE